MKRFFIFLVALMSMQLVHAVTPSKAKKDTVPTLIVKNIPKAPVAPFLDTLFFIYGDIGAVTVQQRASLISHNIKELNNDGQFIVDSLMITKGEGVLNIVYMKKTIMGINDQLSTAMHMSNDSVAKKLRSVIAQAVEKKQEETSWLYILKRIGLALLVFGITFFLMRAVNIIFRKLRIMIQKKKEKTLKTIYNIVDADHQVSFVITLLKMIRVAVIIVILYLCISTLFSIFPSTKGISSLLIEYVTSPLSKVYKAVSDYMPKLFTIIVILALFHFLRKGIKTIAQKIQDGALTFSGFYSDWAIPTYNIINVLLYIFSFVIIFPYLPGSDSDVFKGVSVFMGIMFSLGSTSIIGNIVSGLVITYMRPFKIGDRVQMGDFVGDVIEKTPLVTRIKTVKNEIITMPNSNVMSAQTINYTNSAKEYGLVLHTTVTIGYDAPWPLVHQLLLEAASNTECVLKTPKPFILQTSLDDFYVSYQLNVYTRDADKMPRIYSNIHQNIQDSFARGGVEIMSPHYTAMRDGSDVAIPASYLTKENARTSPFSLKVKVEKSTDISE